MKELSPLLRHTIEVVFIDIDNSYNRFLFDRSSLNEAWELIINICTSPRCYYCFYQFINPTLDKDYHLFEDCTVIIGNGQIQDINNIIEDRKLHHKMWLEHQG